MSGGRIRSIVEAGMTSARPRGPAVDMPSRAPAASTTGPPSSPPERWRSSVILRSMRPPPRLCQAGPSERTIPRRTSGAPRASAAKVSTSAPSAGSAGSGRSNSIGDSSCKATIFVPGSRPATRARIAAPSVCTISAAPARGNTCSEATTRLFRHRVPLNGGDRGARIATIKLCADAVADASAAESCSSGSLL